MLRRTLHRVLVVASLPAVVVLGAGCGGTTGPDDDEDGSRQSNQEPTASIVAPDDGDTFFEGEEVTFEAEASDPEDGTLTGDALVWESDADGEIGTGQTVSTTALSATTHTITLTATDSDGRTARAEISITVEPNGRPTASIASPTDGASFDEGEEITFEGSGDDPEDGTLTGDDLVWTSDLDGEIGTGQSFTRDDLTAGDHDITLTATDSRGAEDSETVTIAVEGPPSVTISSPPDQSVFEEGESVTFEGAASDPTEGDLSGSSLEWSSDVDGSLGTGETVTTSQLSAGPHTVTLTATDGDGNTASASVGLLVEAPGFDFRLRFVDDFTANERDAIRNGLDPWRAALTGDLSPFFPSSSEADTCLLEERGIDDLVIAVRTENIDGPGGILAQAGPCLMRTNQNGDFTTSISGIVTIDEADLGSDSEFVETITHEVGHVLGIGISDLQGWGGNENDLNTVDPFFTGPSTVDAFDGLSGSDTYLDRGVPLANTGGETTFGAHWRELNLETELMTGVADPGDDPLSRVSIAAMADIGYEVDLSAADPYSLPTPQRAIWLTDADATLSRPSSSGENFGSPDGSALGETLVAGSNNDQTWSSDPEDEVFSAVLRTELPVSLPSGVSLDFAAIRLMVVGRNTETSSHSVDVVPVTSSWSEGSVTWDSRPSFGSSAVMSFDYESCDDCFFETDALTDLVTGWLDGSTDNNGLLVESPDAESDPTYSVGYGSRHDSDPSVRPRIVVEASPSGASQANRSQAAGEEGRPRGADIRDGLLIGVDDEGRVVRVERIRAGGRPPETEQWNEDIQETPDGEPRCCEH